MKSSYILFGYILIGCWLSGVALGQLAMKCPNDELDLNFSKIAGGVLFWPIAISAAITTPRDFKFPEHKCRPQP